MAERESITCHCILPVARRTSWTEKNPGRRFNSCLANSMSMKRSGGAAVFLDGLMRDKLNGRSYL
ncbi:hypothetical protein BVRB_012010 [Beta vulgaris subsp. vulgaris]|uniref:Uncharacterized protein n=1 Tax=Beta vulgaris subsp. vulgaris TaxID=3555 RepID=A0A0J8B242_BETVV|nr:hypothetical protein BVRB_012010 [Beta vulgaris subsp. vulgaris]